MAFLKTSARLLGTVALTVLLSTAIMPAPSFAESMAAETTVTVGGAPMLSSKNIIENASHSKDHTTLVAAVKAAGLVETLSGPGPFTVFAPTNAAFEKLPAGTVDSLLLPENKDKLASILTYHVVAGKLNASDIAAKAAEAKDGKFMLKTVQGEEITLMKDDAGAWWVVDAKGGKSAITIADVNQSNGVIHVIDTVLMP